MTFDQWIDSLQANNAPEHILSLSMREMARRAWDAATKAERSRCAQIVVDNLNASPRPDARDILQDIREQEPSLA